VGDILAAFAKDQSTIDETLPDTLHMTGIYLIILITALIIVIVSIHYYAAVSVGLFVAFFTLLVGEGWGGVGCPVLVTEGVLALPVSVTPSCSVCTCICGSSQTA